MHVSAEQVQLCLSMIAYAGSHGDPSRSSAALHRTIASYLERLLPEAGLELTWGPASVRPWWQSSAPAVVGFVVAPQDGGVGPHHLVLRGGGLLTLSAELVEGLGCLEQAPWLWLQGDDDDLAPAICAGLSRCLDAVHRLTPDEGLPGGGRSLAEHLREAIAATPDSRRFVLDVVGHGVGGSLASVVALWLRDTQGRRSAREESWDPQRQAKLRCTAFASPTPGNADFAGYLEERLEGELALVSNTLDPASMLWDAQAMLGLPGLYQPHVDESPGVRLFVDALANEIERQGIDYEQVPTSILEGELCTTLPPSFAAQAEYQHVHAYVEQLGLGGRLDRALLGELLGRSASTDDGPLAQ
ncbi:lipase family protein [Plesiocystis pacifica]|uniref:lipase family protein n=1 Tax=Plesiocystis pacifica TaxID=191768 RepID=UPI0012F7B19B|nr:hypothetical protein [Plesiocystis pacifica]